MTPNELAKFFGIRGLTVRRVCRKLWPRTDAEKYRRWILDEVMVAEITLELIERGSI